MLRRIEQGARTVTDFRNLNKLYDYLEDLEFYLKQLTMGVLIFRSDKEISFTGDEQHFLDTCREEYEFRIESEVDS